MRRILPLVLAAMSVTSCSQATDADVSDTVGKQKWILSLTTSGAGSGTLVPSPAGGEYATGTSVTITATPDAGSDFTGWNAEANSPAACLKPVNPCVVGMDTRKSAVGIFAPSSGVRRFDGEYIGTATGSPSSAVIKLTITNGVVQGTLAGTYSNSPTNFSGTVSATGAFSASFAKAVDGICPAVTVVLSGQVSTAPVSGIMTSLVTASFGVPNSPQGCGSSYTMSVARRTVPFEATGV